MIRRAKRGSQEFAVVSWDDALNEVARNFERIKAEWGPGRHYAGLSADGSATPRSSTRSQPPAARSSQRPR